MAAIKKFEDIEAWQKARRLTRGIFRVTSTRPFSRNYVLRDQIQRAAVSVLSNIAEGFEREGDREFRQALSIAKGSVGEIKAQLYVALDADLIDRETFAQLYDLADEVTRMIGGFMRYLGSSEYKGSKFK